MQTFFTLSSKQSKDLDKPLYCNARQLNIDAALLANKNSSNNRATALLVLSLEELIKASLVKMHNESLQDYKLKDAKYFFSNHKIRHQIAQLVEVGNAFYEVLETFLINPLKLIALEKKLIFLLLLKQEIWLLRRIQMSNFYF